MERLHRILAARGVASRRAAEQLIRAGRVTVDGQLVTEVGAKADPARAEIRVDGRLVRPQRPRYVLLNKPRGYITTTSDERGRRTVMDLVSVAERIYPVGRLDRDTEGLLLLTNDGDVANRVMHPRYGLDKEYHVLTPVRPSDGALQRLRDGIMIEGRRVVPREARILRETPEGFILRIVVHEGLHHLIRRMMDAVGIPVQRLRRVRLGPLSVAGLPVGAWRDLTPGELTSLFQALHLDTEREPRMEIGAGTGPSRGRATAVPVRRRVAAVGAHGGMRRAPLAPAADTDPREGHDRTTGRSRKGTAKHDGRAAPGGRHRRTGGGGEDHGRTSSRRVPRRGVL